MKRKADERLQSQLQQKLLSHGVRPPCRVTVTVNNGVVTLAGTVQYEYQRLAAVHACRAMSGVKRVSDNVSVPAVHKAWGTKEWETKGPAANKQQPSTP